MRPHSEPIFNKLELVNEYSMVALSYLGLNFVGLVQVWDSANGKPAPNSPVFDQRVEYVAIALVLFMSLLNFGAMVKLSIAKLMLKCRQRKAQKAHKAAMAKRSQEKKDQLEAIQEEDAEEEEDSKEEACEDVVNVPYDDVDIVSDISDYSLKDDSQNFGIRTSDKFTSQPQSKPKLNRFGRPKGKKTNGQYREYKNLFRSEQNGLRQQTNIETLNRRSDNDELIKMSAQINLGVCYY